MSATMAVIEDGRRRFDYWLCRRFGHRKMVVDKPWKYGGFLPYGVARTKRQRHVRCPRCGAGFIEWKGI